MYTHNIKIRVRYAETDQMGYVYYGNYASYYEIARVEALRNLGISYADIEKMGVIMPVLSLRIQYHAPALYDEVLAIQTIIPQKPQARICFVYKVYNSRKALINSAETHLAFLKKSTRKPMKPPQDIVDKLEPFFETD